MAKPSTGAEEKTSIAQNRRALHDFNINERFEAGLVLTGTEVKACREGQVNLADAFVQVRGNEAMLLHAHIPEYKQANRFNHEPRRARKLLLHKSELHKLAVRQDERGQSIVPLALYWKGGRVKVELGVGTGKTGVDRRATIKERESRREVERALRRGR